MEAHTFMILGTTEVHTFMILDTTEAHIFMILGITEVPDTTHLHDTGHNGGPHLHDTGHIFLGREHGNSHIIKGEVVTEKDKEEGVEVDYHINYSVNLQERSGRINVNDSYFYRGFGNYMQRGYLRFSTEKHHQNHIVFINDKRIHSIRGEENRKVYFQIRKVPVVIGRNTVEIFVANNFDVVPHRPTFPLVRKWKNNGSTYHSYENGSKPDKSQRVPENLSKLTLRELSHRNFDISKNSNSVAVQLLPKKQGKMKDFLTIKLTEEINTQSGFLKMWSTESFYEDILLFVSERSRIRKGKEVKFELKTVPLLIAGNTIEMDVAYFKETFWLARFILWIARGLKRLNPF